MRRLVALLVVVSLALPLISACGAAAPPDATLRFGVLPILDVVPIHVAEKEGYYREQGISVEVVQFGSALERDTALQAGQIDGELNDLVSALLLNKDADRVRVVRVARRATADRAQFLILAAPNSRLQGPADLKGVEIGISTNTVIEYMTDRILQQAGLATGDIKKTEVTKIPVRLELLAKGQIQAATLPDPLSLLAVKQGARIIGDDTGLAGISQSSVTVRSDVLKSKPQTVRKFLAAYEKAVQAIAQNPAPYMDILIEKGQVPEPVRGTFAMPPFPGASVPSKAEVDDVTAWALEKGLIPKGIAYDKLVDGAYLPK